MRFIGFGSSPMQTIATKKPPVIAVFLCGKSSLI